MNHQYIIKRGELKDIPLIIEIGRKTFSDTFSAFNKPEDMHVYLEKSFTPKQVKEEIEDPDTVFILAFDEDKTVGYAKIRGNANPDGLGAQNALEIERIYAIKEYIGKDVGKTLIEACINYARDKGHDKIWLGVWEHNPRAIAFYEKWGFEKFGSHPFLLGTDLQTDYLMKRDL